MVVQRLRVIKLVKIIDIVGEVQSSLDLFLILSLQAWTSFCGKTKKD